MDIGSLTGSIELENNASDALKDVTTDLERFDDTANNSLKSFESLGVGVIKTGALMSAAITAPLVGFGKAAFDAGRNIEGAMNTIARKTGETGATLDGLKKSFETVFVSVPNSAQEVGAAIADVNVRLGLTGTELETVTKKFIDFANVNQVDVATATKTVSTLMGALSEDTKLTAAEIGNASSIMDKLTYASQISGASVTKLAHGVVQGGVAFVEMGFGLNESIALFTQFEKVGANVSDVTSSLGKAMSGLVKEGVTDLAAGFKQLVERIRDAPTFADSARLSFEAFGERAGRKLAEEIRGGTFSVDELSKTIASLGNVTENAEKNSKSFSDTLGTLRNKIDLALAPIGKELIAAFETLIPNIVEAVGVLTELTRWFTSLPSPIKTTTIALLAIGAAIGPVTIAFGGLLKLSGGLSDTLSLISKLGLMFGSVAPAATTAAASVITAKTALTGFGASGLTTISVTKDLITGMTAAGIAANANHIANQKLIIGMSQAGAAAAAAGAGMTKYTGILGVLQKGYIAFAGAVTAADVAMAKGTVTTSALALAKTGLTTALTLATNAARAFWIAIAGPIGIAAGVIAAIVGISKAAADMTSEEKKKELRDYVDEFHRGSAIASGFASEASRASAEAVRLGNAGGQALQEMSEGAKALQDELTGKNLAETVNKLRVAWETLTPAQRASAETVKRFVDQILLLRDQGAPLPGNLKLLADAHDAQQKSAMTAAGAYDSLEEKISKVHKSIAGLTSEQKLQIIAGEKANLSNQEIASGLKLVEGQARPTAEAIKTFLESQKGATKATDEHAKALEGLLTKFTGAGVLTQAKLYEDALKKLGNTSELTKEETDEFVKAFDAVIAKYKLLGPAGASTVKHFQDLRGSIIPATEELRKMQEELNALETPPRLDDTARVLRELSEITPPFEAWRVELEALHRAPKNGMDAILQNSRLLDAENLKHLSTIPKVKSRTDELFASISTLARGFEQLANISGGALAGFAGQIGNVIGSIDLMTRAIGNDNDPKSATFNTNALERGMSKIKAGDYTAGFAEMGTSILGVASAFMQATSSSSTLMNVLGGAATGAQFGSMFGPIGTAIGAGVGAIGGAIRSLFGGPSEAELEGRQAAHSYIDGLKSQFNAGQIAEIQALVAGGEWAKGAAEQAIALGGIYKSVGLSQLEANKMSEKLWRAEKEGAEAVKKVIEEIEEIRMIPYEVGELLKEVASSGTLVSQSLLDIVDAMDETGRSAAGVTQFVAGEAKRALDGLKTFVDNATFTTEAGARAASAAVGSAFGALLEGGMSTSEAIKAVTPLVESLKEQMVELGVDGTAAFEDVDRMVQYMAQESFAKAIEGAEGINQALIGLHNSGLLTQETFEGLTGELTNTFTTLQAEGFQGNEIIRLMAPSLQTVWELMEDFGYEVDATTQKLIDQGIEAGAVGDIHRDVNSRIALGIERLVELMGMLVKSTGQDLPGAFEEAGTAVENFGREGLSWVDRLRTGVDGVSFGSSPGGIKEWPIQLAIAHTAFESFSRTSMSRLKNLRSEIDNAFNAESMSTEAMNRILAMQHEAASAFADPAMFSSDSKIMQKIQSLLPREESMAIEPMMPILNRTPDMTNEQQAEREVAHITNEYNLTVQPQIQGTVVVGTEEEFQAAAAAATLDALEAGGSAWDRFRTIGRQAVTSA